MPSSPSDARGASRGVDWLWITRVGLIVGTVVAGAFSIYSNARGHAGSQYGFDFHGIWSASKAIRMGLNPYQAPVAHRLLETGNPYVLPPLAGEIVIPLSYLPFWLATLIWNVLCLSGLVAALAVLRVRDLRVYVLAIFTFPFISSLALGQPDGLFALLAAIAWRWRDARRGAAATALLIAAKLLAWPLLLWMLWRRRLAVAGLTALITAALLLGSWAVIGFDGFSSYARLLAADARGFEVRSHSIVALALRLGVSANVGLILAVLTAAVCVWLITRGAIDADHACFAAALLAGLLISPIMWTHYLVLLLVPVAIRQRQLNATWLLVTAFWISPAEPPATTWQVLGVIVIAIAIAVASTRWVGSDLTDPPPATPTAAHDMSVDTTSPDSVSDGP